MPYCDCRMFCLLWLLERENIKVSQEDIFGIGGGINFAFSNMLRDNKAIKCPVGRNIETEELFCKRSGIKMVMGNLIKEACKEDAIKHICSLLAVKGELVLTVDRWFLDYLRCKKSHMGYHQIILTNYDYNKNTFNVLDGLCGMEIQTINSELLLKAIYSDWTVNPHIGDYYYIDARNKAINDTCEKELIIRETLINLYNQLDEHVKYIAKLRECEKILDNDRISNFIYMQKGIFTNSFIEQDKEQAFYRQLYLRFLSVNVAPKKIKDLDNFREDYKRVTRKIKGAYNTREYAPVLDYFDEFIIVDKGICEIVL